MYIYQNDLHGTATTIPQLVHKGKIYTQDQWHPPCISEWDLNWCQPATLPAACYKGEIYTQGHGIHVYIRWDLMQSRLVPKQLVPTRGEIYTQGHGPPCISGFTLPPLPPAACATRRKQPGTRHSSMYISEPDDRCCHYSPAASGHKEKNIHPGTLFSHIYRMDLHAQRCDYYQQLVPRGEYTPRDMAFLHVYIRMGSTRWKPDYYQQLQPAANIHPGTWHLMYSRKGEHTPRYNGIPCRSEWIYSSCH
jgi:hypothetical protein